MSRRPTSWLIDTSAYVRLADTPDPAAWIERIERGLIRICTVTRLELGYAARNAAAWDSELKGPLLAAMPVQYLTPNIEDRAVETQGLLADRGHHRAPSIPDLLIAAAAELEGLTVLHYDKDFELIAELTGQEHEWIAKG